MKSEYATKWCQFFLVWSLSMRDSRLSRIYTSTTSEWCVCKRRWEKMEKLISRVILCGYYFTTTLHGICLSIYISRLLKSVYIKQSLFFFLIFFLLMAVLGLRFCARAFSSCGERGPLFIAVRGPLITIAASLVAEHRLQTRRLSKCGSRA